MKKTSNIVIKIATLSVLLFSIASTVYALDYTVLEPLPGISGTAPTKLSDYLPAIFKLAIGVSGILAFVMITFGGIMYATSDSISGKTEGKGYITNALWGLLLVVGAYAILNTINPQFVNFSLSVQNIVSGNAAPQPTVAAAGTAPVMVNGVLQGYELTTDQVTQDQQIRANLSTNTSGKVTVNNSACATGGTIGCTNVVGLPPNAITGLETLGKTCNCFVEVTGGTEGGHATHGPGLPVVDLSSDSRLGLNAFLAKTNPAASNPVSGTTVTVGGATYTYENTGDNGRATGAHWHVVFQ